MCVNILQIEVWSQAPYHMLTALFLTHGCSSVTLTSSVPLQVGCTAEGKLLALKIDLYNNGGNSLDLSASVMDRALLHCENSYRIPNVRAQGYICRTNTASNTAFRGFGGPQVGLVMWISSARCDGVFVAAWPICKGVKPELLCDCCKDVHLACALLVGASLADRLISDWSAGLRAACRQETCFLCASHFHHQAWTAYKSCFLST